MSSLKSFIKAVRAAKTIADERTVIQKESAAIRTSFRENYSDQYVRRQNVAKLLYLFTLGERTHFGQVECLKLLATSKFTDKRLGYLGTMLLLDENQEVLTLLTNSLNNDLTHPNQYIAALALCTLANIASSEMSRDLFADIEKILSSSNPYLRKKAALCAMRITRKVPDLEENFIDKAKLLLNDKNHGVLLCGISLVSDLCIQDPDLKASFKPSIPLLLKHLKALSSSGYSPEHDVTGISDPFLQVKILKLLRILGEGDKQASEQMSDLLAQVASNTDSSKNVGNAVLYEAAQTIFGIEADPSLRVLGVNILGKFLTTKDNNTKYVSLNALLKVIDVEHSAVQRHRATVIECLQDADISIRRRALELSYALINSQNVRVLVRELLAFLETADNEFKSNLTSQIAVAAERFAPNPRWHIDTILRTLKVAGSFIEENVLNAFITLVITTPDLQLYTVQKLYSALRKDFTQEGLVVAGVWLIGEYANTLLNGGSYEEEELVQQVNASDIVKLFESILSSSYATEVVQEYVTNALVKLTVRVSSPADIEQIRRTLDKYSNSIDVEIQQRVAEYGALLSHDTLSRGVLEKMPPPELKDDLGKRYEAELAKKNAKKFAQYPAVNKTGGKTKDSTAAATANLLDLLDETGPESFSNGTPNTQTSNADLLSDLFSSTSIGGPTHQPAPSAAKSSQSILDLFDQPPQVNNSSPLDVASPPVNVTSSSLFDLTTSSSTPPPAPSSLAASTSPLIEPIEAYNKNSLLLSFQPTGKDGLGSVTIQARFTNTSTNSEISGLNLQVAVPKSQKLQLQSLSASTLAPGDSSTQLLKITASPGSSVKLRLRVIYTSQGQNIKDQVDFNKFPSNLV